MVTLPTGPHSLEQDLVHMVELLEHVLVLGVGQLLLESPFQQVPDQPLIY